MALRTGMKFSVAEDEKPVTIVASYPCIYDSEHKDYKNVQIKGNVWKEIEQNVGRSEEQCKKRWRAIKDNFMKIKKSQKLGTGEPRDAKKPVKWYLYEHLKFLATVKYERRSQSTIVEAPESPQDAQEMDSTQGSQYLEHEDEETQASYDHDSEAADSTRGHGCIEEPVSKTSGYTSGSSTSTPSTSVRNPPKRNNQNILLTQIEKRAEERTKLLKELYATEEDDVDVFMKSIAMTIKKLPPNKIAELKIGILNLVTEAQFPQTVSTQQKESPITGSSLQQYFSTTQHPPQEIDTDYPFVSALLP